MGVHPFALRDVASCDADGEAILHDLLARTYVAESQLVAGGNVAARFEKHFYVVRRMYSDRVHGQRYARMSSPQKSAFAAHFATSSSSGRALFARNHSSTFASSLTR